MQEYVIEYFLGLIISGYFWLCWSASSLPLHIASFLTKRDIYTFDDLIDWVESKSEYLADMLSCNLCLTFWISVLISAVITNINSFSLWFVPACSFSWPFIIKGWDEN